MPDSNADFFPIIRRRKVTTASRDSQPDTSPFNNIVTTIAAAAAATPLPPPQSFQRDSLELAPRPHTLHSFHPPVYQEVINE
ncbi:hypothetical protein E4U21_004810 [Claviceps maximensis]|nr:hypothetical protein E4U21_004810 [Claviceps maximensis]